MNRVMTPTPERPLLEVEQLRQNFKVPGGVVSAVADVSFDVRRGETLGLVGESGCGKSTLARSLVHLPAPTAGSVKFDGEETVGASPRRMRKVLRRMQMIFQDPISALNPRRRVKEVIAEGLAIRGVPADETRQRVEQVMREVGLDPERMGERRPGEFSGGQCQRIAIARAMVLEPELLILDEPVSALDVSVQAQVLNVLEDMRSTRDLAMLFIAHDLSVVRNVSDRVAVMYLGRIVELGDADEIYRAPAHPYTRALVDSVPDPDPRAPIRDTRLTGELPSPLDPPSGCRFRTRCPMAQPRCAVEEPELRRASEASGDARTVACHFPLVGTAHDDAAKEGTPR